MQNDIAIYTLTSALHDEQSVKQQTEDFLESIGMSEALQGPDFTTYGSHALDVIYVRTGGTEGIFNQLLPQLKKQSSQPFFLLTSGKSNSLAASMEILSFLRQRGEKGEIIHGEPTDVKQRITSLSIVGKAIKKVDGSRLGIIGAPSDWLIASNYDPSKVRERLGIDLVDIPMDELQENIRNTPIETPPLKASSSVVQMALPGAFQIYKGLQKLLNNSDLQGFTIRCFDLLKSMENTGCYALAQLNASGYVATCEGDVPAMLSMYIAKHLIGVSGFQANPSQINPSKGEMIFAHCTIPFDMVSKYELDTHFESGVGVGIKGYMPQGDITIFKVSGNLDRYFIAEGTLLDNLSKKDLCRTQVLVKLDDSSQYDYFLTNPIGNHHVILPGHHRALLETFMKYGL